MSEGDVSLIRDEDVLRRMWQQTEDFSRKKEIRAHMYRLREERLRSLYSPEPGEAKGCEFSSTQGHVQSFADQTFQSMKSKEVRDAGSPPKEFTYRGQDLKELSNAGWNVESENRTTDDGHTHVKSVNANIEGRYDVEGGRGQFAAVDQHKQAVTEYHDDNSSLKRNETASNTAAREHVVRQTDDGTQISSTTSSSTSTSKFQQMSSTKHETVPYLTNDDYDRQQTTYDTNSNQEFKRQQVNQTEEFKRNLRKSDVETGELVSRKIDYPDDNTRVVVETRCLPDGTRVTSTRREFRGTPVVQKHSEQHSQQTRNESRSSYSSTQKSSDVRESSSKIIHDSNENQYTNIVDSQKNVDTVDFKKNQTEYIVTEDNQNDQYRHTSQKHREQHYNEPQVKEAYQPEISSVTTITSKKYIKNDTNEQDIRETQQRNQEKIPQIYQPDITNTTIKTVQNEFNQQDVRETNVKDNKERIHHANTETKIDETVERKISSDQYQTTYQSDFTQKKKISNDWSPTHQAWASTLRADTPSTTRPSTRASSPGGRTYQSSTSSLRSSVSPDKSFRKPSSRGGSPSKVDRYSPTRSMYSSTHSTHSVNKTNRQFSPEGRPPPSGGSPTRHSPEIRPHDSYRQRPSVSPDKRPAHSPRYSTSPERKVPHYQRPTENTLHHTTPTSKDGTPTRFSASPERKPFHRDSPVDQFPRSKSPTRPTDQTPISSRRSQTPERKYPSEEKEKRPLRPSASPDRQPVNKVLESHSRSSPDRKPGYQPSSPRGASTDKTPHKPDTLREISPRRPTDLHETKRTPSRSPEKQVHHKSSPTQPTPISEYKRYTSPTRPLHGSSSPERPANKIDHPKSPSRDSSSPEKTPGYMKPTGLNKQSPTKSASPDRKTNRTTKVTEDHYKFIDEETKMYTRKDADITTTRQQSTSSPSKYPTEKATSPVRNISQESPDHCRPESPSSSPRPTLRKGSRSPSPPKGPVTFSQDRLDTKSFTGIHTDEYNQNIIKHSITKDSPSTFVKDTPIREPSPSKYGTYDKKQRQLEEYEITKTKTDDNYDSLTRREKSASPRKTPNAPSSPTKKSPRDSSSPTKPIKDHKYKHTNDFISSERTTEEINKSTKLERPRQLVTPSTSPTRRPNPIETAPSTGQSSPTTSVSGFVYFGSPRTETTTMVTDLDEQEDHYEMDMTAEKTTIYKRPESLDVKRSPSPSKIPCRSSPQEKSPASSLPRKSSLKKPSQNLNQVSPVEKPPSSFQISPTVETPSHPEHKIVKKDRPEHSDIPTKTKPPLERRETYDERCRKILGMVDDDRTSTTTTVTMETLRLRGNDSNTSSPSISPCRSPKDELSTTQLQKDQEMRTKVTKDVNVSEFLSRESQDNHIHTDVTIKSKTPSRDQSPTKLQDIITRTTKATEIDSTSTYDIDDVSTTTSHITSQIPKKEKKIPTTDKVTSVSPTHMSPEKKFRESPDRKPGSQRPTESTPNATLQPRTPSPAKPSHRESVSPQRTTSDKQPKPQQPTASEKRPNEKEIPSKSKAAPKKGKEGPKHSRTPSPTKKTTVVTEISTDFLMSEREQEILDRVQKSLRKLSPDRKEKSPSRERSPSKTTTSLLDLDISTSTTDETSETTKVVSEFEKITEEKTQIRGQPSQVEKSKPGQAKEKPSSKPSSRNVSPVKKSSTVPMTKSDQSPTSPTKPRSTSPKKLSGIERPQSPQTPKASGIKPREPIPSHLTRKPTPTATSPTKAEKTVITTDTKKISKQNSLTKINTTKSTTNKFTQPTSKPSELDTKRAPISKGGKESPKKDTDSQVTRTPSDSSIKPKKTSPQRMRSKPEIQVNDFSTSKRQTSSTTTTTTKTQKSSMKEPQSRLPSKPKSATALNTSTDEDDIIIDVQQAKSSRENSPDRICPTPVGFNEDVGTPRFPDEVSEPDDEFRKRTYHTIHEAESIVDDIVEICEDDELFVKQTNVDRVTGSDECLLSVNDKVSKFTNKVDSITKPKMTTTQFKDTERRVHSDFVTENLKSDECLLSVSEKVNKFAKGPRETTDSKSPSRRIVDEYDTETVYQDDYTKLSVNDKAHLFVETAENVKTPKIKPTHKVERPDFSNVDESLKSDDCLLSVSDKVNKFVKTAEQFLDETIDEEEKERKIKEQHDKIMKKIEDISDDTQESIRETTKKTHKIDETIKGRKSLERHDEHLTSFTKETASSHGKLKDTGSPNFKPTERTPTVKITTLRSSEAVKKAKALFENIASTTQQKTKDTISSKTTKLMDIGVIQKSPKTDSTVVLHPSSEDVSPNITDIDSEIDGVLHTVTRPSSGTPSRLQPGKHEERPKSPGRLVPQPTETSRTRSPMRQVETVTTTKTVLSDISRGKSPKPTKDHTEKSEKPQDQIPGYLRPTKTSQNKEETKVVEEIEVSSRRGSGKFGVELRRTSVERSTVSSERRRSVEHPCIEDIFDLDLLEQMLEKVVGYEQRRRIRSQIRVAKKKVEEQTVQTNTQTRTTKQTTVNVTTKHKSPERLPQNRSPERKPKSTPQKTLSPQRTVKTTPQKSSDDIDRPRDTVSKPILNGHAKEPVLKQTDKPHRPLSPEKPAPKSTTRTKSPVRHPSPEKKTRPLSPSKIASPKSKQNRFNEYASAYMKKVGLNESDKIKFPDTKAKKITEVGEQKTMKRTEERKTLQTKQSTTVKSVTERTSSKDAIKIVTNGKRSPSPEKKRSPERQYEIITETRQRSPSPILKRQKSDTAKKETIIKTIYDIEKKIQPKPTQEEKPSWVTNRNLKKITSETRTFSSKKIEPEKPKYRAPSPSKIISKPLDVITSSYGPGPLDAEGRPLFGIKALRNGASNYQVKGTVIRQEFHSRNGGEPEGSVSVTAYSSSPEELERLLATQGERPSRLHGLAAITTTKKFGGDTGTSYKEAHTKEERAALEQFTHQDRRVSNSRVETIETSSDNERLADIRGVMDKQEKQERIVDRKVTGREERLVDKKEKVVDRRGVREDERRERVEKREDRKTVRQSSVKSLTEKYIKSASETTKTERSAYPKAGLILRTTNMKDSVSSDSSAHAGLARTDSEHSLASVEDVITSERDGRTVTNTDRDGRTVTTTTDRDGRTVTTTTDRDGRVTTTTRSVREERSFLDSSTKVSGVQDILTRMKNADIGKFHDILAPVEDVITGASVVTDNDGRTVTITDRDGHTIVTTTDRNGRTVTAAVDGDGRIVTTTNSIREDRSFLNSSTKVSGVQDILTRMKNADIVIQEGDTTEDSEARALLNKFLGATVLMAGMQNYVQEQPAGRLVVKQETVRSSGGRVTSDRRVEDIDLDQCWDERVLRKLLDECSDYEQRRRLRARIRTLMAEQEACASAVTEALAAAGESTEGDSADTREEEEVTTVTSSVRRNSSEKTVSSSTTTKTSKVTETKSAPKPVSPFAKFRQLEKQNSTSSPNSPVSPSSPSPYFKFTDPAVQASALTIKERLLQWCRDKTRDYENVKLENFSTSWADGLAFCALVHHFLPNTFDYSKLVPERRRQNFTLAFKVAEEKAGIYPLLDVDDMVAMRKPDWKCVFTYVQSIHRRFKDQD